MLTSFEIKNFRTFSHLRIERLGRVNLIVGKNNVGKTTLLEALRLYGSYWLPSTIASVLHDRDELSSANDGTRFMGLESMFHGCEPKEGEVFAVRSGNGEGEQAELSATARLEVHQPADFKTTANMFFVPDHRLALDIQQFTTRMFTLHSDGAVDYTLPSGKLKPPEISPDTPYLRGVGSHDQMHSTVVRWWDAISLTEAEPRVLEALQLIAPIRGVNYIADPRAEARRMAKVRLNDLSEPVPLARLGDGAVRMFQIAVALEHAAVYAKAASRADSAFVHILPLLLIDEVETGIHHTLHAALWRFIFHASRLLDVQIFATTHSLDCLRGFDQALKADAEADGLVIRLEGLEGHEATRAVVIDRSDLPIVIRDSIEVR